MRRRRTTPHEKELYWVLATSQREDDHQYTVKQRVFETVLRCLDEPLPVAEPAKEACESTKKILKRNKHPRDGADKRKDKEKGPSTERRETHAGHVSTVCRHRCASALSGRMSDDHRGRRASQRDPHLPQ